YRCFFPPGQVFALGVMYRLFDGSVRAAQMLNVVYATLTVLGVWYIARQWFGQSVARAASLLAAFLPSTIFACMLIGAEVPEAFWLTAALCFHAAIAKRSHKAIGAFACGLCLGIGSLIRPTLVLLPLPIGLHMLLTHRNRRGALISACAVGIGVAATVLPWTYRNYRVTGGFILISSNGGQVLYSANNDDAQGDYTESATDYLYRHAPDDLTLQNLGTKLACRWIRANPRRFLALGVKKFV
ncbi:unnamed protein product, partial [marine sediment metagenome]